jgi:superfamily I DNA/RNA helicase
VTLRWLLGNGSTNWRAPAYARIWTHCYNSGEPPWQVLDNLSKGTLSLPHTALLVDTFEDIRNQLAQMEALADLTALVDFIFPETVPEVGDLRKIALAVMENLEILEPSGFLTELISAITKPEVPSEVADVRIMSLHKSKGLSSPVTIIAGCVEGLLPMKPKDGLTPAERDAYMEEQRRLFYVGITRVKAVPENGKPGSLIMTYSQRMPLGTAMRASISPASVAHGTARLLASRFITELGPQAPAPIGAIPTPG